MNDWKPIEELKTETLKDGDILVLLGRIDSIVSIGEDDYGNPSYMFDNAFLADNESLLDALTEYEYTRYILLTPPKS